jgi:hypothetical protein
MSPPHIPHMATLVTIPAKPVCLSIFVDGNYVISESECTQQEILEKMLALMLRDLNLTSFTYLGAHCRIQWSWHLQECDYMYCAETQFATLPDENYSKYK